MRKPNEKELTEYCLGTLVSLNEHRRKLSFDEVWQYEVIQECVEEGLVEKVEKIYNITEKGEAFIQESIQKKERKAVENTIPVTYKALNENTNRIENKTTYVHIDPVDNLPIFVVNESSYVGLINRELGQHWRKFIGPSGQKLVRDRKLTKFYVENADNGRRYLYLVPKKDQEDLNEMGPGRPAGPPKLQAVSTGSAGRPKLPPKIQAVEEEDALASIEDSVGEDMAVSESVKKLLLKKSNRRF